MKEKPIITVNKDGDKLEQLSKTYLNLLLEAKRSEAGILILQAVENGVSIKDIYLKVFQYKAKQANN